MYKINKKCLKIPGILSISFLEPGGVWSDLLGLMMVCSSCIQEIMERDALENLVIFFG